MGRQRPHMPIEDRGHASVVTHALAREYLTTLRDATTDRREFHEKLDALGELCGYELIEDRFGTASVAVETPLATAEGARVAGREDVVLVSVLRAALPLVSGLQSAFPGARQGVVSASRDETTDLRPDGTLPVTVDYVKVPEIRPEDTVIVADPMLATGSTLCAVLDELEAAGSPDRLLVLAAVSAPEGLARLADAFPAADLVTVGVDEGLDENGFIVPGLGDAGDRAFGNAE